MKLTNYTSGPKTINTTSGPVMLAPGATSEDIDVSEGELAAMDAVKFLGEEGANAATFRPTVPEETVLNNGGNDTLNNDPTRPVGTEAGGDEVQQLVDGNTKAQLLEIAEAEGVEGVTEDNNKQEIAAKIVEARNAE